MNIRAFFIFISLLLASFVFAGSFAGPPAGQSRVEITELRPGLPISWVESYLSEKGVKGALKRRYYSIYETPVLPFYYQRQRLVLLHKNQTLAKTAVIIEFDFAGSRDSDEQLFLRILNQLMGRYGAPHRFYERGAFRGNVANQVRTRRLVRIYEWHFKTGVLRFGIPERFDRKLRMELHFARGFPSLSDGRWGLDTVF